MDKKVPNIIHFLFRLTMTTNQAVCACAVVWCGKLCRWAVTARSLVRPFSARSSCYISKMPQIALTSSILVLDADDRPLGSDKLSLSHQSQSSLMMRVDDDFVLGNPEEEDKCIRLKDIRVYPLCALPPSNRSALLYFALLSPYFLTS